MPWLLACVFSETTDLSFSSNSRTGLKSQEGYRNSNISCAEQKSISESMHQGRAAIPTTQERDLEAILGNRLTESGQL